MRMTVHLQERHLAEAVRRKVISEEQYQGILGVARAMAPAEGQAPELGWVAVVHGVASVIALGVAAIALLDKVPSLNAVELLTVSAVASFACWMVGLVVRRAGLGRVPASVFTAGTAVFSWGIGAALAAAASQHSLSAPMGTTVGAWFPTHAAQTQTYLAGSACVLVAAVVIGRVQRVAAVAAVGAMATIHLVMGGGELLAAVRGSYFNTSSANVWLIGLGLVMLAAGRAMDRIWRGRIDAAFWVHALGLLPLGLGATMRIEHSAGEGLLWSAAAVLVAFLGVRWDRRVYLVAAAVALTGFPALALLKAHAEGSVVVAAFVVSVLAIGAAAAWLRGYYTRVWIETPGRNLDRTVWE